MRASVPDSEIITVGLVAAKYLANNHTVTLRIMQELHYLSATISRSRFSRRLHGLRDWMGFVPEPVCQRGHAKRCTKYVVNTSWVVRSQARSLFWMKNPPDL